MEKQKAWEERFVERDGVWVEIGSGAAEDAEQEKETALGEGSGNPSEEKL